MMSGIRFNQGDVVIVPFPFSNLSAVKQRPVLILSNNIYNDESQDVITCGITSNLSNTAHSILVGSNDLEEGSIPKTSRIKADKLFTLEKTLIIKKVATVNKATLKEVKEELMRIT